MKNLFLAAIAIIINASFLPVSFAANIDFRMVKFDQRIALDQNRRANQTVELQIKLETAKGVQQHGQMFFPYIKGMNSLNIEEAFTIKVNGRRIPVDMQKAVFDQPLPMTTQAPMFSQVYLKSLVFPSLEPGDSIFVRYKSQEQESMFPGHFSMPVVFPEEVDYGDIHLQVRTPANMPLHHEQSEIAAPTIQERNGWKFYDWYYTSPKKERANETREIAAIDTSPRLIISSFSDWKELAAQYQARAVDKVVVTPAIAKLADDITQGISDRREQARLLYNWVNQNIRYVAVLLGEGMVVPHSTASILENRYGDCKDHVVLLEALLTAKGIASSPALINAGPSYRLPSVALPNIVFNHAITYLPEFDLFVDATEKSTAFGELAFSLGDKPALLTANAEIKKTPVHSSSNTYAIYDAVINFDANGDANTSVSKKMIGYETPKYRWNSENKRPEERIKEWLTKLKLTGHLVLAEDDPKKLATPHTIAWKGKLDKLADFSVKHMQLPSLPLGNDMTVYAAYVQAQQARQQNAICPGKLVQLHFQLTFPKNMKVASLPKNIDVTKGDVRYIASYSQQGQTIDVRRVLDRHLTSNVCTPEQLREWLPVAQAILKDHQSSIEFK